MRVTVRSTGIAAAVVLAVALGGAPLSVPSAARAQTPLPTAARQQDTARHAFVYRADRPLTTVHLAGTFNHWNKGVTPMTVDADGRTWRVTLPLPFGSHRYKFVLDGETWVTDPAAKSENDGNGNINSVLVLFPPDYARPARPNDGVTAKSALLHETRVPFRNYDRGALTLSLRVRPGDVRAVTLVSGAGKQPKKRTPLRPVARGTNELYTRFVARLPWDRKTDLAYWFEVADGPKIIRYGAAGVSAGTPKPFVLSAKAFQPFAVPGWVEKTVFYQIFPDRFDNGSAENDPKEKAPWDTAPQWFHRFGGDAAGVRKRADYLQSLGVSAVYFNPVFASPSNHRYDAADFRRIDPEFGTNAEFASLTRDLEKRGIRTVMDFVFNHSATTFGPFADVREKGPASPYKDWFFVREYPVRIDGPGAPNYVGWNGYAAMPKMNVLHPPTRDYLLGLVDFWDKEVALSGMRLDVANEVDPRFWRLLRERAKRLDPQMWIVGEVWGDGTPWLGGDQWDSVMNYPFRDACLRFFAEEKETPSQFLARLMGVYESYAPQVSRNLMNLLSSHDTPRFLTQCGGDAARHRLAAAVQFTWVGAPSIYYGEELGMEGGPDPDNRRGMRWDLATPDNAMLRYYKRLIAARNASPALKSGDPQILFTDDAAGTLAYARVLPGAAPDAAVLVLNRSDRPRRVRIALPAPLRARAGTGALVEAIAGRKLPVGAGDTHLTLTLAPRTAALLLPARSATRLLATLGE
mgnify:CR=1 FL=1|jgi:Glycosidases